MHRESKKPRKRRMLGKSTLFSLLTVYCLLLSQLTNNEQRKCEYRYLCSGGSRGGARGPEPLLFPLLLDQTEARRAKKIFLETTSSPPLITGSGWQGPPLFEGLDPLLLCLISLVHSKNQAANQMTYNDVIRLQIVWIVSALATVHQLCRENYRKSIRPFSYLLV